MTKKIKKPGFVEKLHGVRCSECGDSDQLDVAATLWIRLTRNGSDADASFDGSHEWDDKSEIICNACNHTGTVGEFRVG